MLTRAGASWNAHVSMIYTFTKDRLLVLAANNMCMQRLWCELRDFIFITFPILSRCYICKFYISLLCMGILAAGVAYQCGAQYRSSPAVPADQKSFSEASAELAQERAVWATEKQQQEQALQDKGEEMQESANSVKAQEKAFKAKWAASVKADKELQTGEC